MATDDEIYEEALDILYGLNEVTNSHASDQEIEDMINEIATYEEYENYYNDHYGRNYSNSTKKNYNNKKEDSSNNLCSLFLALMIIVFFFITIF